MTPSGKLSSKKPSNKPQLIPTSSMVEELSDIKSKKIVDTLNQIKAGTSKSFNTMDDYFTSLEKGKGYVADYVKENQNQIYTTQGLIEASKKARAAQIDHNNTIKQSTIAYKAAGLAKKSFAMIGNIAATLAIGKAVEVVIGTVYEMMHAQERMQEKANELGTGLKNSSSSIEEYKKKITELQNTINDSSSSFSEVQQARVDLMGVQDELIEKFGTERDAIDTITTAINTQADALDNLSSREYFKAKTAFNEKSSGEKISDWLSFGSINNEQIRSKMDKMASEMNFSHFNFSVTGNEELDQIISKIYGLKISDDMYGGGRHFSISGSLSEISEKLYEIQSLSSNFDVSTKFENEFTKVSNSVSTAVSSCQDLYNQYILWEKILNDSPDNVYKDKFDAVNDAKAAYDKAAASNDAAAASKAADDFYNTLSDAADTAMANGEKSVSDYFINMHPALKQGFKEWSLKLDLADNVEVDGGRLADKVKGILQGLDGMSKEEILRVDLRTDSEQLKQGYVELSALAEGYHLDLEQFLPILEQAGMVESELRKSVKAKFKDPAALAGSSVLLDEIGKKELYDWIDTLSEEDLKLLIDNVEIDPNASKGEVEAALAEMRITAKNSDPITFETMMADAEEDNFSETLDKYQSNVESLKSALDKLKSGTMSQNEIVDLIQQFPQLAYETDNLQYAVERLLDTSENTILDSLNKQIVELVRNGHDASGLVHLRDSIKGLTNDTASLVTQYQRWKEAQSTVNDGDVYVDMVEGLKKAKELYDDGLVGTDDFKTFASMMSPSGADDPGNFIENYKNLKKYFDSDTSRGVEKFLDSLSKKTDKAGNAFAKFNSKTNEWTVNISDTKEAAKSIGMGMEPFEAMLKRLNDYGFDIDIVGNFAEASDRVDKLQTKLDELNADPNVDSSEIKQAELELNKAKKAMDSLAKDETIEIDVGITKAKEQIAEIDRLMGEIKSGRLSIDNSDEVMQAMQLQKQKIAEDAGFELEIDTDASQKNLDKTKESVGEIIELTKEAAKQAIGDLGAAKETIPAIKNIISLLQQADNFVFKDKLINFLVRTTEIADSQQTASQSTPKKSFVQNAMDLFNRFKGDAKVDGNVSKSGFRVLRGNTGNAFADGLKNKDSLIGELGEELLVRNGQWHIMGEHGAEKFDYKKGDIIFNSRQTKELLDKGYTTSRGRALADGNAYAYAGGGGMFGAGGSNSTSQTSSKKSKKSEKKAGEAKESADSFFDWIEVRMSRLEKKVQRSVDNIERYVSEAGRRKYASESIKNQTKVLETAQAAYDRYMNQADGVNLSQSWRDRVHSGAIDISSISDEKLSKAISDYQQWYDKAQDMNDTIMASKDKLTELSQSLASIRWDKAAEKVENYESQIDILNARLKNTASYTNQNKLLDASIKEYDKSIKAKRSAVKNTESDKLSIFDKIKKGNRRYNSDGTIKESGIVDEKQLAYIKQYNAYAKQLKKNTVELAIAEEEYKRTLAETAKQQFDNIQSYFENKEKINSDKQSLIQSDIDLATEKGYKSGTEFYNKLIELNESELSRQKELKQKLSQELNESVKSGSIKEYSQEWYDMSESILDTQNSVKELERQTISFSNSLRQIKWDAFDGLLDKFDSIVSESEFLIQLLSNDKLVNDDGSLTNSGIATMGQHALNFDTYFAKAEEAKKALSELDEDSTDQNVINRRKELLELQQQSISSALSEKHAMIDLAKEGIQAEIDAFSELISKKKEALDKEKELNDYQKNISNQKKEILRIEKQLNALESDDSDEAKKKRRELNAQLAELKDKLADTEYDKNVENQKEALDKELENYKESMEDYMEDGEQLFEDALDKVNSNSTQIGNTIKDASKEVGYEISRSIADAWKNAGNAVTDYSKTFTNKSVSILNSIAGIRLEWENALAAYESYASATVNGTVKDYTASTGTNTDKGNSSNNSSNNSTDGIVNESINNAANGIVNGTTARIASILGSNTVSKSPSGNSKLNRYVTGRGYAPLSFDKMVSLANALGLGHIKSRRDVEGDNDLANSNREDLLNALKKAGFSRGGSVKSLNKVIHENGDDGIATLKVGEEVLTKEKVEKLSDAAETVGKTPRIPDEYFKNAGFIKSGSEWIVPDTQNLFSTHPQLSGQKNILDAMNNTTLKEQMKNMEKMFGFNKQPMNPAVKPMVPINNENHFDLTLNCPNVIDTNTFAAELKKPRIQSIVQAIVYDEVLGYPSLRVLNM